MVATVQTNDDFAQYLPENEFTVDDVKSAYREAVKEKHPDHGGTDEEFKKIHSEAKRLESQLTEDEVYALEQDSSTDNSDKTELADCWERGLQEVNECLESDYQLSDFRTINSDNAYGLFEDDSKLSFAIEAETSGTNFSYETTYFVDGHGEVGNYSNNFDLQNVEMEKALEGVAALSAKRAEKDIKEKLRGF